MRYRSNVTGVREIACRCVVIVRSVMQWQGFNIRMANVNHRLEVKDNG